MARSLKVEPDVGAASFQCAHCGADAARVLGYVTDRGGPLAVYHADLYVGHSHAQAVVLLTISLGDWSEHAVPTSRHRARLEATPRGKEIAMTFVDFLRVETTEAELGVILTSDEARRSEERETYLLVADAVVYGDPRVARTLGVSTTFS